MLGIALDVKDYAVRFTLVVSTNYASPHSFRRLHSSRCFAP